MKLVIDQMLHGYKDGHRRLAGSIEVDQISASKMLMLSDLLASGVRSSDLSYICGYPLKNAGKYVFSRTWMAREMRRPGCVWTHSLILDYELLPSIQSLGVLGHLHDRPQEGLLSKYESKIEVSGESLTGKQHMAVREKAVLDSLSRLYGASPNRRVGLPAGDHRLDEALLIGLWDQMWPRLRRVFFFCSLTNKQLYDPDAEAEVCILVGRPEIESRNDFDPLSKEIRGLAILEKDILYPDYSIGGLRRFLARYAVDTKEPWVSATKMATIYDLLACNRTHEGVAWSAEIIRSSFPAPGEASILKRDFVLGNFPTEKADGRLYKKAMFFLGLEAFKDQYFSIKEIDIKELLSAQIVPNARELEDILAAVAECRSKTLGHIVFNVIIDVYSKDYISSLDLTYPVRGRIALYDSRFFEQKEFWRRLGADRVKLLHQAIKQKIPIEEILEGVSCNPSWEEISSSIEYEPEEAFIWILTRKDEDILSKALEFSGQYAESFSHAVQSCVNLMPPEHFRLVCAAIISFGLEDRFDWTFWDQLTKGDSVSNALSSGRDFSTLVFGAAMHADRKSAHKMLAFSFDLVFGLSLGNKLPFANQKSLQRHAGLGGMGENYFCDALLKRVIHIYLEEERLSPEILCITSEKEHFSRILNMVFSMPRGKSLLKGLRKDIDDSMLSSAFDPYGMIGSLLKKKSSILKDWGFDLWRG